MDKTYGDDANDRCGQLADPCQEFGGSTHGVDVGYHTDEGDCSRYIVNVTFQYDLATGNVPGMAQKMIKAAVAAQLMAMRTYIRS